MNLFCIFLTSSLVWLVLRTVWRQYGGSKKCFILLSNSSMRNSYLNIHRFLIQKGPKASAVRYMGHCRRSCKRWKWFFLLFEGLQKRTFDRDLQTSFSCPKAWSSIIPESQLYWLLLRTSSGEYRRNSVGNFCQCFTFSFSCIFFFLMPNLSHLRYILRLFTFILSIIYS